MDKFIANRIISAAKTSFENGVKKYKQYFVDTTICGKFKSDVDTLLTENGYNNIVIEVNNNETK